MEQDIINLLSNPSRPSMSSIEINDALGYKSIDDYKAVMKVLEELCTKGILYYSEKKKKYLLLKNSHLVSGKMLMNPKGFGFVSIGEGKKDIYVHHDNLNGARNLDTVLIELIGDKTEGRVHSILKRNMESFVGTVYFKDGKCMVHPDNKKLLDIEVMKECQKGLVDGHKVVVEPVDESKYLGSVTHVIGHKNDVGVDILSFVYENNFKPQFPEEVLDSIQDLPDNIEGENLSGRLDLRNRVIFTIDGDDTKDIDDAVSILKNDDGTFELGVHIADVSHYVKPDTLLDKEAYERGTSVYLVDRVIPMLPHRLSNGICSLNPNVDRLSMSCIMKIDSTGKIISHWIGESVIRSRIQMTYNKVNDILDKGIIDEAYQSFADDLRTMRYVSDLLRQRMVKRGYIEFHSNEAKIIVDDAGKPVDIRLRSEGTGENMIENFMVAANETVASSIFYQQLPGIYRVHSKPDEKRLNSFFCFLASRGYKVNGKKKNITARDLQNVLKQLEDKPDAKILNDLAIRSQAKAVYSDTNIGHFGLGSKCYAHFTSPIRRYPDLILHRLVKDYQYHYSPEVIEYWNKNLSIMALHCSEKEQDAVKCERDVDDMKKAEYMESHIGETFTGVISGVQEFGVFVELPNTVEGLARVEDMPRGGYRYIEDAMCLINSKTKDRFGFGDEVIVQVIKACKENSTIDFKILGKVKEKENENSQDLDEKSDSKKYILKKNK